MRLLFGNDAVVVRWAEQKMDGRLLPPWQGIGIIDGAGCLRGALVLQPVTAAAAELTICSDAGITPRIARGFFRHAFETLGIYRLQIRTDRRNAAIKRAAPKMGFKFEGTAVGYWGPGGDALVFSMTPDRCRWLRPLRPLKPERAERAHGQFV